MLLFLRELQKWTKPNALRTCRSRYIIAPHRNIFKYIYDKLLGSDISKYVFGLVLTCCEIGMIHNT